MMSTASTRAQPALDAAAICGAVDLGVGCATLHMDAGAVKAWSIAAVAWRGTRRYAEAQRNGSHYFQHENLLSIPTDARDRRTIEALVRCRPGFLAFGFSLSLLLAQRGRIGACVAARSSAAIDTRRLAGVAASVGAPGSRGGRAVSARALREKRRGQGDA